MDGVLGCRSKGRAGNMGGVAWRGAWITGWVGGSLGGWVGQLVSDGLGGSVVRRLESGGAHVVRCSWVGRISVHDSRRSYPMQ